MYSKPRNLSFKINRNRLSILYYTGILSKFPAFSFEQILSLVDVVYTNSKVSMMPISRLFHYFNSIVPCKYR